MTDRDLARALLSDMMRVRRMEEKCAELYGETKIRGFLHLYVGEEAVAAGSLRALTADDAVVATYREHAHALLRGMPMTSIMAEMFGKQEGCSRGRGGSMHLFDAAIRFYGGNAIVAGGLPLAVGLGLADAMQHRNRVTACYFGDGAVAEGAFHESLNMAALWQLPVLFCCENNLYAMGTALERAQSQTDLTAKAAAYKVPTARSRRDGRDCLPRRGATGRRPHPHCRWPVLHRVPHVSLPRTLDVRPRTVSREDRGRRVAQARPDPHLQRAMPAGRHPHLWRYRLDRIGGRRGSQRGGRLRRSRNMGKRRRSRT